MVRFANSVRLRLAMRMRYADPGGVTTTVAQCYLKPLMGNPLGMMPFMI